MAYAAEVRDVICQRIANQQSLVAITRDPAMPGYETVCRWLREDHDFRESYARAREDAADAMASEIVEIADTANEDNAQAIRVRVDARKWVAAKLKPRVYGDRLDLNHTGEVALKAIPDDRVELRLADLLGKAGIAGAAGGAGTPSLPAPDRSDVPDDGTAET
jgi:hypothetical protein